MSNTSDTKAHAEFSASGSERWLNCPGSIALSRSAPEQRESPYAKEGTDAHACLEFLLKNGAGITAKHSALRVAHQKWPIEMVEHALNAYEIIWDLYRQYPGAGMLVEAKVDASPFTCEGQFGTLDVAIVQEFGRLVVIDYKYGAGHLVDPAGEGNGNSQLVYYALGISHLYAHNFSSMDLVVIQPRAYTESGETVRIHSMTIEQLLEWEDTFRLGVEEAKAPQAALNPGSWCRWCPAAVICPEVKKKAMEEAQIVFDDAEGIQSIPEPRMISLLHLGTILSACDKLEDWIGKVREHAMHVLERGHEVEGWKLVQKRSIRKWIDEEKTAREVYEIAGEEGFSTKLLSPAQLEKTFPKGSKIHDLVKTCTISESSGTTLAPESDKRPAVNPVQNAFAEIEVRTLPEALSGKVPRVRPANSSVTKPERVKNDGSRRK